jgi:hypothetical protein
MLNALLTKSIGVVAVAGGALLAASPAQAQFARFAVRTPYYRANLGQNLYTGTIYGRSATYNPFNGTYYRQRVAYNPFTGATYDRVSSYNRLYGRTYGYYNGYTYPAYAGYSSLYGSGYSSLYGYPGAYGYSYPALYGAAYAGYAGNSGYAVNDGGNYLVSDQQARQARLDARRRTFDEYLYERQNGPTWEDERERLLAEELRRSRNEPPLTEIWSGKALNVLLGDLQRPHRDADAAAVALDLETVKRINFTTRGSANIGLLKDPIRLAWPVVLGDADYREARERLTVLAREAVEQATSRGRVDGSLLDQMAGDVDRLQETLHGNASTTTPQAYIEAKQFLNRFDDALKALGQPDVGSYFNGKYAFQGKNVADLVQFMSSNGLQFAAAVPGDEAAYSVVHRALVAYDWAVRPGLRADVVRR